MRNLARIQLIGPLTLLAAVAAADAAAYALAQYPSSAFLWYLNLDVFSVFRKSRAALGDVGGVPFAEALLLAGPIALVGLAGIAFKKKLCLAISSNLALVFSCFIVYCWLAWGRAFEVKSASLAWPAMPSGGTSTVLVILALTCVVSFAASHSLYIMALRSGAR